MCAYVLTACESDFDEFADSVQRRITLNVDPSHLFDSLLVKQGSAYALGAPAQLDADYRLRITAYCYDAQEQLQQSQTLLSSDLKPAAVTFRHIDKDVEYRFVVVADVVKSDPYVDYYESWFQLDTRQWSTFYLFSDSRNVTPQYDAMMTATVTAKPQNQEVSLPLMPLTYNGYLVLDNANMTDRLTGYAGYTNIFLLKTKAWQRRTSVAYDFAYYRPTESQIVMPLNLCYADSVVYLKVKSTTLAGNDSVLVNIPNARRRPFVATVDCERMTLRECKFY